MNSTKISKSDYTCTFDESCGQYVVRDVNGWYCYASCSESDAIGFIDFMVSK